MNDIIYSPNQTLAKNPHSLTDALGKNYRIKGNQKRLQNSSRPPLLEVQTLPQNFQYYV